MLRIHSLNSNLKTHSIVVSLRIKSQMVEPSTTPLSLKLKPLPQVHPGMLKVVNPQIKIPLRLKLSPNSHPIHSIQALELPVGRYLDSLWGRVPVDLQWGSRVPQIIKLTTPARFSQLVCPRTESESLKDKSAIDFD